MVLVQVNDPSAAEVVVQSVVAPFLMVMVFPGSVDPVSPTIEGVVSLVNEGDEGVKVPSMIARGAVVSMTILEVCERDPVVDGEGRILLALFRAVSVIDP